MDKNLPFISVESNYLAPQFFEKYLLYNTSHEFLLKCQLFLPFFVEMQAIREEVLVHVRKLLGELQSSQL